MFMKRMSQPVTFALLLTLAACGGKGSSSNGTPAFSGPKSCLSQYDEKIADLLPLERVRGVLDLGSAEPEQKVQNHPSLKGVSWSWDSDRTREMTVGGQTLTLPVSNQVSISQFKLLDQEKHGPKDAKTYVENNFRSISAEEMTRIQAQMQEQIQKRVEKGEMTAEQAKLAGGMGEGFMGTERVVDTIEGVGDACRWTAKDKTLAVGHRNVFFTIYVDVNQDNDVNRDKAVELAKAILAECD